MKRDSSDPAAKLALRRAVLRALPPGALILETCAGVGTMWRGCWRAHRGAALDRDAVRARAAALVRPTWAVYAVDAEAALWHGLLAGWVFDVVDVDPYGSPWPIVRAFLARPRRRAPLTHLVVTDGYASRAFIARPDRALFDGVGGDATTRGLDRAGYDTLVRERVAVWAAADRQRVRAFTTSWQGRMCTHLIELTTT